MKRLLYLLPLFLLLAACDSDVGVKVGGADVELGDAAVGIAIQPGQATAKTGTISGGDLPDDGTITAVELETDAVSFTASGKAAQSGSVDVLLTLGGWPVYAGTVTVVNNNVTAIDPSRSVIGEINRTRVESILNSVPEDQRPSTQSLDGLTAQQIADNINAALRANSINVAIVVTNVTGDLRGALSISSIDIDSEF